VVWLLLLSVFTVATCGLIYELIAGTLASYLLGDSVTQFSTVIGCYLFAMGIGAYLSRFVKGNPLQMFIRVELLVAAIGGGSAAMLFFLFEFVESFRVVLYLIVLLIGIFVGLEIPLLMRVLKERLEFQDLISKVLSFDYLGALLASVLFPLVLVPYLGLVRTGFFFGILNSLVAVVALMTVAKDEPWAKQLRTAAFLVLFCLSLGFWEGDGFARRSEASMLTGKVIFSKTTPYQRIVLTRANSDFRLFLNGHLQFSSKDEYRYHEALVHPAATRVGNLKNVLVLGGGDGMAVREILKYPSVEKILLVDLDPAMTEMFKSQSIVTALNGDALNSKKVEILNVDGFRWVRENSEKYDLIVIDFPDPTNYSLGKLYTTHFYSELKKHLAPGGIGVVQSTSPLLARKSFWCIAHTLEAVSLQTTPYHVYVPSFGEWGYVLFEDGNSEIVRALPADLKFLDDVVHRSIFTFPPDMAELPTESNQLTNQALVRLYDEEWSEFESH